MLCPAIRASAGERMYASITVSATWVRRRVLIKKSSGESKSEEKFCAQLNQAWRAGANHATEG